MDMTAGGRWARIVFTVALVAATLAGSVWGSDDEFPFGPFRMYSTSRELSEPVADTQVHAVDATGNEIRLVQDLSGMRRAEIEGQLQLFRADPGRLGLLAQAYDNRYPDRPPLEQIAVVIEWIEIEDGRPTGESWTEELVTWRR